MSDFADGYAGDWLPHKATCRCEECSREREISWLRERVKELEALIREAHNDPHSSLTLSLIDRMGTALAGGKGEK